MEDGVEDLDIELFHGQQLLLRLVEGQRARVDPPQPGASDDRRHGRGEVGAVTLLEVITLQFLCHYCFMMIDTKDLFLFPPLKSVPQI